MAKTIFKSIFFGLALGAGFFFIPKMMIGLLICSMIFGMFARRRMYMNDRFHMYQFAYADKIRNMSDDEYKNYQTKINEHPMYGCHCHHHHQKTNSTTN